MLSRVGAGNIYYTGIQMHHGNAHFWGVSLMVIHDWNIPWRSSPLCAVWDLASVQCWHFGPPRQL